MSNEEKLKLILLSMNSSEIPLELFFERLQKDTGGKITFSSYKNYLDKYYECINKSILYIN